MVSLQVETNAPARQPGVRPVRGMLAPLGIRARAALVLLATFLAVALPSLWLLMAVIDRLTEHYGMRYARDNAALQKERLLSPTLRDLVLARKLADSPVIRSWARNESDPAVHALAIAELESYKRFFQDTAYFVAIGSSRHYYFSDAQSDPAAVSQPREALDLSVARNAWFPTAMASDAPYMLNVDNNGLLGATKVWINVPIRDGGETLGIAGTGVDLGAFVTAFLADLGPGISGIIIDRGGAIQVHENRDLIDLNTRSKAEADRSTIYRRMESDDDRATLRAGLDRLQAGASTVESFPLSIDGRTHLVAATFMPELGWFNLTLVDPSEAYGAGEFLPVIAVLAAALLAIVAIVTLMLNRTVLNPLLELTRSAKRMAEGRYDVSVASDRGDEIGELTRAFRRMAATVRDHTALLERRVRERTEELTVANAQLAESNLQILDSIRCAKVLQTAILPRPEMLRTSTADHFVVWKPRDLVGGDFYFCHEARDGILLGVVDCTGHGVPGAFMTMLAHAVISQVVKSGVDDDPALLLARADATIREALDQRGAAADAGMEMAVCRIVPSEGRLVFAGARISLWHAAGGDVAEIKGERGVIGYRSARNGGGFVNHAIDYGADSVFYLTTDGVLDQAGGNKGFGFGRDRFVAMLREHASLPLDRQGAAFEALIADYQQGRPQRDDITFLGFRPAGAGGEAVSLSS
ncbi:sigma-B regulation protein RsbU (phosphoserine phosphatase) [Constrictibacter sp. MBR-5]|uniref:SpoIIE family protein phosphatase n=1 Tax=Constrictibacter sp. MBR-5 TaxID=3156467 RepID=UPI003399470A